MSSLPLIQQHDQSLSKPQRTNLALLVDALIQFQTSVINQLATGLVRHSGLALRHAIKRTHRFLANPNWNDTAIAEIIISLIWPRLQRWQFIPVIIDWTYCEEQSQAKWWSLVASIPLRGRGIPLLCWSIPKACFEPYPSQNQFEKAFVRQLLQLLPAADHRRLLFICDRGFARAELLQWLKAHPLHFIIRLKQNSMVKSAQHTGRLDALLVPKHTCRSLGQALYHAQAQVPLTQVVVAYQDKIKEDGTIDPWFLATSLNLSADRVVRIYAKRMTIEEDFKEAKTRLLWKHCRIRKPAHYQRFAQILLLVLVLATLTGLVVHGRPTLRKQVSRQRKGVTDTSITHAGLKLLRLLGLENLKYVPRAVLNCPI